MEAIVLYPESVSPRLKRFEEVMGYGVVQTAVNRDRKVRRLTTADRASGTTREKKGVRPWWEFHGCPYLLETPQKSLVTPFVSLETLLG